MAKTRRGGGRQTPCSKPPGMTPAPPGPLAVPNTSGHRPLSRRERKSIRPTTAVPVPLPNKQTLTTILDYRVEHVPEEVTHELLNLCHRVREYTAEKEELELDTETKGMLVKTLHTKLSFCQTRLAEFGINCDSEVGETGNFQSSFQELKKQLNVMSSAYKFSQDKVSRLKPEIKNLSVSSPSDLQNLTSAYKRSEEEVSRLKEEMLQYSSTCPLEQSACRRDLPFQQHPRYGTFQAPPFP